MNSTVAKLLGEQAAVAPPPAEAPPQAQAAPEQDYSNPTVDQLLAVWQGGNHEAVALRVLDALDHYEDFLELAFRIGHEGALELGRIMDELTSDQKSPHHYDTLSDQDIPLKAGKTPRPSEVDLAAGSPE